MTKLFCNLKITKTLSNNILMKDVYLDVALRDSVL